MKKSVLVVDDEPELCLILKEDLALGGFEAEAVGGGHEAIERLREKRFDAVVSDVRMPKGSGLDVLRAIRAGGLGEPVVFLFTGFADLSTPDAYEAGVAGIFQKPADTDELLRRLERALTPPATRWAAPPPSPASLRALALDRVVLGRTGFFAPITSGFPAVGEAIRFDATAPDGSPLTGVAETRWVRKTDRDSDHPAGFGAEVLHLPPSALARWLDLTANSKTYIPASIAAAVG